MEKTKRLLVVSILAIDLLLCFAACADSRTLSRELEQEENEGEATWCIAKPSTDSDRLYKNIDYSCKQYGTDCRPIQPGGVCFSPDSAVSHASFAMNLYYKSVGKHVWNCDFGGTGLIVSQDPSVGSCNYPA